MLEIQQQRPKDISKACRLIRLSRSSLHYQSIKDDVYLEQKLQSLTGLKPEEGFWKCYNRIRNEGEIINHKRVYRVYKKLGLSIKRKCKKRLPTRVKEPLEVPNTFGVTWSMDFMTDVLSNQTKFRTFNIIDDYNREVLFIEVDYSLKSSRVIYVLRHLINKYGKPQKIRMDNGPEFVANLAKEFAQIHEIEFKYIQPGKPTQNAYIERFNRTYRQSVLDTYIFDNLDEVREQTEKFIIDYNLHRPHDALQGLSPINYKLKYA